ncbi:MAG: erythromycin esterase family protein [Flavobacteriaceae bacterium]
MNKIILFFVSLAFCSCNAQVKFNSNIEFTSDLENFENLSGLKKTLKNVEIVALGENTHGLGEVFEAKAELVKFLHQELKYDLVLFESGYGDAALAWEKFNSLSTKEFTSVFSSNFYYNSEEIENLVSYIKSQHGKLKIQGFDCQPQQNYLIKRMAEIVKPVDSILAKSVPLEMRNFNNLYQFENDKDTLAFNKQRDRFIDFLNHYTNFLNKNANKLLTSGTTKNEIDILKKSNEIFVNTYSKIHIGEMMSWPISDNIRDRSLFEIVKSFKQENPESKIIIWAQNSHIENKSKPNYNVNWMGHQLKRSFGDKYFSIGAIVYSGKNLNYNGTFDFEHTDKNYLAYHLNLFQKEKYVLDLRKHNKNDFTSKLLVGMENFGNTAEFIAKDRFDGLLFVKYSDIPKLLEKE